MAEDRGFSDLISTATKLLNSQGQGQGQGHSSKPSQGSYASTPSSADGISKPQTSSSSHAHKPSYGEVYASAQIVMDAAKSKLQKADSSSATNDIDYGKLAGAAGTLISAASHYGKLEESGAGKYAQKAQQYLNDYERKHGKPGTTTLPSSQPTGHGQGHSSSSYAPSATNPSQPSSTSQNYPTAYPPQGYPDTQQGYGYASQGHNKPAGSQPYVDSYPPAGYPPAGYPSSGTNYNPPSGYPSSGTNNPPAGYPSSGTNYSRPSKYS